MKHLCTFLLVLLATIGGVHAQSTSGKLPWAYYMTMTNNCNSADIVLLKGEGGSVNIDDKNMGIVKDFVANTPAEKIAAAPAATIMCLKDGREFISGQVFLEGNEGIVSFVVEGKEYINQLSSRGIQFFRSVMNL